MSCSKPRVSVFLDDELLAQIENFRYDNRCDDRSDAIRRLIKAGLETYGDGGPDFRADSTNENGDDE